LALADAVAEHPAVVTDVAVRRVLTYRAAAALDGQMT